MIGSRVSKKPSVSELLATSRARDHIKGRTRARKLKGSDSARPDLEDQSTLSSSSKLPQTGAMCPKRFKGFQRTSQQSAASSGAEEEDTSTEGPRSMLDEERKKRKQSERELEDRIRELEQKLQEANSSSGRPDKVEGGWRLSWTKVGGRVLIGQHSRPTFYRREKKIRRPEAWHRFDSAATEDALTDAGYGTSETI